MKWATMALHNPQYIFGDFNPDEFNQFFVTPRSSVELLPYSGTVLYGTQAMDKLPEGQEYQRIEFGVNEAPEFILGCTTSKTSPDSLDKEASYSSMDCQYPGSALAVESSSNVEVEVLENDGISGGLRQRERKKKKKQPPGYYSYLKDGGEDSISPEALANGHANSAVLNSDAEFMGDMPPSVTHRTCNSPQNSTDSISDNLPGGPFPRALSSNTRTAEQPEGVHGTDCDQSCFPAEAARDNLLRTAVAQPCVGTNTTENLGVANGKILESSAANEVELHTTECIDLDPTKPESASPADGAGSASGAIPISQPKSWASLFHDSKPPSSSLVAYVETKYSPPSTSPLVSEKRVEVKEGLVPVSEDPVAIKIAELLENVTLIHKPVSLQPRELINKGNWCYINALVACPLMYCLMKFIPLYSKVQKSCTSTRMTDSFVRLMNEFTNMPVPPKSRQALGDKIVTDIRPEAAFAPTYIYRLLTVNKSSLSEKGQQEDAEKYLGFILNRLHEEMLNLKKLLSSNNEKLSISNRPRSHFKDEWEQVGPRNKTSITCQVDFVPTPITSIFGGHIRSVVYQQSSKESATLQPFITLQLDIQSDKICTVQDALESLAARESVQGYTTKTKQEIEISQRVTGKTSSCSCATPETVYKKTGGCQKLIKNIEYPADLEISKKLLSPGVKNNNFKCHRTYQLFVVVYHHSNSLTGMGLNGWLRIDDQTVVKPTAEHTAYLLYYRRVDLL
uniref:ubiquitinyl hydrolase 1 n=1 Tax=Microcebus murinus TaxID=30608 RepID=A0A8C5Y0A9_MICMU